MENQPVLVNKLAALAGVTVCTIRVYERKGLIQPLYRGANGYRYYDVSLQHPIRVFGAALSLGISLNELGEIFAGAKPLKCEPTPAQAHAATIIARQVHERHVLAIGEEMRRLADLKGLLEQRVAYCSEQLAGPGPVRIGVPTARRERLLRPGRVEYVLRSA